MTTTPQPLSLVEVERAAIVDALRYTGGNVPGASWVLDCGLSTLRRRMRNYEIQPEEWMERAKGATA